MTLKEAKEIKKNYISIVKDMKYGDAGHKVTDIDIRKNSLGDYSLFIIAEDGRSGVPMMEERLEKFIYDNNIE